MQAADAPRQQYELCYGGPDDYIRRPSASRSPYDTQTGRTAGRSFMTYIDRFLTVLFTDYVPGSNILERDGVFQTRERLSLGLDMATRMTTLANESGILQVPWRIHAACLPRRIRSSHQMHAPTPRRQAGPRRGRSVHPRAY